MAHLDAKHIIDGEIDSRLEHLCFISDEVGCVLSCGPHSPLPRNVCK